MLAWVGKHVDPAQQLWLEALRAELAAIDGGMARLVWAVGGLRLIWFERRRHMVNATYRYGPVLLYGLEAALFVGLTRSLIQHYGSLAGILLEVTGLGLVVVVPVLIALVHVIRTRVSRRHAARHLDSPPERRGRPVLQLVPGILGLVVLLALWLSAPLALDQMAKQGLATAGVVVSSAGHHRAEAALDQTVGISQYEEHLITQVKPLAINGVPLAQVIQDGTGGQPPFPPCLQPPTLQDDLQKLVDKFTGIQGYDLAHGQFPDEVYNPDFDAHDAKTMNVLIPWDAVGSRSGCHYNYYTNIGSTITVQSLVTGQTLNLHVVGEYDTSDGFADPLFGRVLADDAVVQTLSGGHPSYAYALHLDMNQHQAVFERLHTSVPTAQLYDFTTDPSGPDTQPSYSRFTDPYPANIWDYNIASIAGPPPLLGAIAGFWAGLLAMIIVLNWEACTLRDHRGLWNRRKG